MTRHDRRRAVFCSSLLLVASALLLAGTAQDVAMPSDGVAVIAWGDPYCSSGDAVQPLGSTWCVSARKEGGAWIPQSAASTVSGWFISEDDPATSRLVIHLDRAQLTHDLRLDASVAATPGAALRVELVDAAGNAVGAHPASNLVAGCDGRAQSYSVALPLRERPQASAILLTRQAGGMIVYNTSLSPVALDVLTASEPGLAETSTAEPTGTNVPAVAGSAALEVVDTLELDSAVAEAGALVRPDRTNGLAAASPESGVVYVDAAMGSDANTGRARVQMGARTLPAGGMSATLIDGPKATIRAGLETAAERDRLVIRTGEYADRLDVAGRDVHVRIDGTVRLLSPRRGLPTSLESGSGSNGFGQVMGSQTNGLVPTTEETR